MSSVVSSEIKADMTCNAYSKRKVLDGCSHFDQWSGFADTSVGLKAVRSRSPASRFGSVGKDMSKSHTRETNWSCETRSWKRSSTYLSVRTIAGMN